MIVLHIDLDNTLIYSYKKDIGPEKICSELYEGREISYVSPRSLDLLNRIREKVLVVPTSTRSVEQYKRIFLLEDKVTYALVCNGGVLLKNGERQEKWYQKSLELVKEAVPEMDKAAAFLEGEERRYFEIRLIEGLFLFTKCKEPEKVMEALQKIVDESKVQVYHNGDKVYVMPHNLSKGVAVKRFREYLGAERVFAAGDSEFDLSMLKEAELPLVPYGFTEKYKPDFPVAEMEKEQLFSEGLLERCLKEL